MSHNISTIINSTRRIHDKRAKEKKKEKKEDKDNLCKTEP